MKSKATTVKDYLVSLPADRRAAIEAVRAVMLKNLDKDYEECMVWGVIGYVVPHRVWPHGHHTDPNKPLMMAGLSSQKNDMVIYLMAVHQDKASREWFNQAWARTGKRLDMSGEGGCCVRFKKLEDVALDVIGESIRRTPAKAYLENHVRQLADRGRSPDGQKLKRETPAKRSVKKTVKKSAKKSAKTVARKKSKR